MLKTAPLLAAVCLWLSGCERPQYHVSGKATYKNEAIPAGHIFFDPDPVKNADAPQGMANIKDGRYDTAQEGKPVIGGLYTARIYGFDGKPANELPLGRPLFQMHTEAVELPRAQSTKDFNVEDADPFAQ